MSEREAAFEEWLSPEIVTLLIQEYAETSPSGRLRWEYGPLRSKTWGSYDPFKKTLIVNKSKTKGLFKQQVQTLLHEIRHWNQHVAWMKENPGVGDKLWDQTSWGKLYADVKQSTGYWNHPMEVDARAFAAKHHEAAIEMISDRYGGRAKGSWDEIIEELTDEAVENGEALTRGEVGEALRAYEQNTPANLAKAIQELRALGVRIASEVDPLRSETIRLAHEKPELRIHLLPLLKKR